MAVQVPKQLESVVAWAKSNTVSVVFMALVVVVPVAAYFVSDMFGSGVKTEAEARAKTYAEIASAANASVSLSLPGGETVELEGFPNDEIVAQYGVIIEGISKDASGVYAKALERNRRHKPIMAASSFPNYDGRKANTVRFDFLKSLQAAYTKLLADARAGQPPVDVDVAKALENAERRFIQGDLKKETREKLTADEVKSLESFLAKARIGEYAEQAKKLSFYATEGAFEIPTEASVRPLYAKEADRAKQDAALFDMQWKFWVARDVVGAFETANSGAASVLQAPVKRLISLSVLPMEKSSAPAAGGEAAAMGGEAPVDGSAEAAPPADGSDPAAAAPAPAVATGAAPVLGKPVVDPKQDAARDFTKRFTGRVSNGVYDVRLAEVVFVAETAQLPVILDALARQNFMTVTNVRLAPADAFSAARDGYLYGAAPVSQVTATVESIWLRDWTAELMPGAVRTALGITSQTESAATPEGDAAQGM
ncbi:MAG: hypothetical protein ACKOYN_11480 [Planctomycetota bacterium]